MQDEGLERPILIFFGMMAYTSCEPVCEDVLHFLCHPVVLHAQGGYSGSQFSRIRRLSMETALPVNDCIAAG